MCLLGGHAATASSAWPSSSFGADEVALADQRERRDGAAKATTAAISRIVFSAATSDDRAAAGDQAAQRCGCRGDRLRRSAGRDRVRDRVGVTRERRCRASRSSTDPRTCEARIVPSACDAGRDADLAQRRVDPGRHPGAGRLDDADRGRDQRRRHEAAPRCRRRSFRRAGASSRSSESGRASAAGRRRSARTRRRSAAVAARARSAGRRCRP